MKIIQITSYIQHIISGKSCGRNAVVFNNKTTRQSSDHVHDQRNCDKHFLSWLKSPILERQTRPHPLHTKTHATGTHVALFISALLLALLSTASAFSLSSHAWRARLHADLQSLRSAACSSQLSVDRPVASISLLHTSLKRSLGLPVGLEPDSNSPYSRSLGIRSSSIRYT